jgi:hypothetical protein
LKSQGRTCQRRKRVKTNFEKRKEKRENEKTNLIAACPFVWT